MDSIHRRHRIKARKPKTGSVIEDIYDDEPSYPLFGDTDPLGSDIDPGAGDTG